MTATTKTTPSKVTKCRSALGSAKTERGFDLQLVEYAATNASQQPTATPKFRCSESWSDVSRLA